jgi:hypothetical protein
MAARKSRRKSNSKSATNTNTVMFVILGLFTIVVIAAFIFNQPRGSVAATDEIMGDIIPIDSAEHVDPGSDPGPYASNPPAGGKHYAEDWEAGFYDESSPETNVAYPQGYLVHNLEHGYVIFWYNCAATSDCAVLKQQIRTVMGEFSNVKLIAFPWSDMDYPLAMASWGRLLRFDAINLDVMRAFVRNNRNQAPEPNMP